MARTKTRREDVAKEVTGPPETADYRPSWGGLPSWWGSGGLTGWLQFTLQQVDPMLDDPVVALGTSIIETPVIRHESQWQILADSPEIQQFVDRCYRTYWRQSIREALYCARYGYSAMEALYDFNAQGQLDFIGTKPLHPIDCKAGLDKKTGLLGGVILAHSGGQWGGWYSADHAVPPKLPSELLGADGPKPAKGLWFYYGSEFNGHYGRSRYKSAFPPWREKNGTDGTLDIIRMWYYKNAYSGLIIRYPEKMMDISGRGKLPARDMARQIAETLKTGGVAALPSTIDPKTGKELWSVDWPKMNGSAEGLLDYKRVNDEDILRGLLIPDDVITGSGGYSGRKVSEDAFYTMEEDLLHRCVWPFDAQTVRPLVQYNFGEGDKYQVIMQPMLPARQQLDAQAQNGATGPQQGGGNPAAKGGGLAQALLGGSQELPPGGEPGQAQSPENRTEQVGFSLMPRRKKPVRRRVLA